MTSPNIVSTTPRYPAPELNDLPEDIKAKVLEVQEKAGLYPMCFSRLRAAPPSGARFLRTTMR